MWIFVDLALVVLAAAYVVAPLLREADGGARWEAEGGEDRIAMLEERKLGLLSELKEMEFDLRAGKLSQADYAELSDRYKKAAAQVLAEIDALRAREAAGPRGGAEGGRAQRRRRRGGRGEQAGGEAPKRFCSGCGARVAPEARFCGSCGKRLAAP